MSYTERIDTAANASLLIQQWRDSPRLRALAEAVLEVVEEELVSPLAALERQMDFDTAEGVWLDHIGARLGLRRPATLATEFDFFGFEGSGGVGFHQGIFATVNPALSPRVPVGDEYYRRLLRMRAEVLLGDGTVDALDRAIGNVFPGAAHQDHGDMTVTLAGVPTDDALREVIENAGLQPGVAGVGETW